MKYSDVQLILLNHRQNHFQILMAMLTIVRDFHTPFGSLNGELLMALRAFAFTAFAAFFFSVFIHTENEACDEEGRHEYKMQDRNEDGGESENHQEAEGAEGITRAFGLVPLHLCDACRSGGEFAIIPGLNRYLDFRTCRHVESVLRLF